MSDYRQQEGWREEQWRADFEDKWPTVKTWPGKETKMSVYQKLNAAREKFHALKLTKTGENKFAGYKYFELGDFLIPALQVFREAGLCAYVSFDADIATMTIVDLEHNDRMTITSPMGSAALKGCHEVQNIGAVETYQRRYLWVAALEIVEHDALDATTGKAEPERRDPVPQNFRAPARSGPIHVDPERKLTIELAASTALECFKRGNKDESYDHVSGITDGDEKLYLYEVLAKHSAMRAYLKFRDEQAAKRARQPEEATT